MRFLLLVVIHWVFAEDTFGDVIRSNVSTHTNIGDTVVLTCNFTFGATNNRWRRSKEIIAKASHINLQNLNRPRYGIVGQLKNEEYNLLITNVIQSDSGLYWCEMNINGTITKQYYTLYISDKENMKKEVQIKSSTKGVQIKSSTKGVQILTTVTKTIETTTDNGKTNRKKTVENSDPVEAETVTNSGQSCQEKVYHGVLGAGLILVSCLLVICSACLSRRCRTKTLEQR